MKTVLSLLCLTLLLGCASKPRQQTLPPNWTINPGQSQAPHTPLDQYTVFLQGPVKYPKILWSEGMTLSRAILTAQYIGRRDPRSITVIRHGEQYPIDPGALLRREHDPIIAPGDLIQLQE